MSSHVLHELITDKFPAPDKQLLRRNGCVKGDSSADHTSVNGAPFTTRILKNDLEAAAWDRFLQSVPGANYYALYGWLKSYQPAGFKPEVLVLERNSEIMGGASYLSFDLPLLRQRIVILPHGPISLEPDGEHWELLIHALDQRFHALRAAFVQVYPHESSESNVVTQRLAQHGFNSGRFFTSARFGTTRVAVAVSDKSEEQLLGEFQGPTRRNVRKSLRSDFEFHATDDAAAFDENYKFLCEQAALRGWSVRPRKCLQAAFDTLRQQKLVTILEVRRHGTLVGNMFMVFSGGTAVGYYSATNRDYCKLYPAEFLQWNAMKLARERGRDWYDFVNLGPPGIERFKRGFAPEVIHWQQPMVKVYRKLPTLAWRTTEHFFGHRLAHLKRRLANRGRR